VPTSVLLAVLAAAGLLSLAPALVRRYDATERLAAERTTATVRVLSRRRRRRTVPGRRPVNPPRVERQLRQEAAAVRPQRRPAPPRRRGAAAPRPATAPRPAVASRTPAARPAPRRSRRRAAAAVYRRRRVLVALVGLNLAELAGVLLVGPGFWIGFSVSFTVLVADLAYLRRIAVLEQRRRRARARHAAWIAHQQAAVRREHARRAAQRREATVREAVRRSEEIVDRYAPRIFEAAAATGTDTRSVRPVRGRPYEHGPTA
jgi:hypothetical protein